jgi:hypothetical protein
MENYACEDGVNLPLTLFRLCNEEKENIKFIDALKRILQLAMAAMLSVRKISEQLVQSMMEAVMGRPLYFLVFLKINSS